jgi:hypothetical protein
MILLCTLLPEYICEREHFCHKLERMKPRVNRKCAEYCGGLKERRKKTENLYCSVTG